MQRLRWFVSVAVIAGGFALLVGHHTQKAREPAELPDFSLAQRPQGDRYLFDYAHLLEHYTEGSEKYLHRIAQRFHMEAVIVSLPDLGQAGNIEELAVDIVNHWEIGRDHEGRGLLLLLVNEEKQVKLEVAYELEDVFTDAFTGYIEDLQLKPYFLRDDLGTGLIAVMEELEQRARLKHQSNYTPGVIAQLDAALLAGGAGAKRRLARYRETESLPDTPSSELTDGAATPQEAWRTMLTKWDGKGKQLKADIYTEMTKLAMGDQNNPEKRTLSALAHWKSADFQVLQDGDHAVIYFGNVKGWNNAPFLFCNTSGGWKFDIVHQRRLVVMDQNPDWKVEQGNYPYVNLLDQVPQSTGKDLPVDQEDLYSCARDKDIADEIRALEQRNASDPDNFGVVMALARLNVITGRRPNHVNPLIKQAKRLDPASAEPYKYSAIYNVNTFFQYQTALKEIEAYIDRRPDDVFGYNFLGFLHYRLGEYKKSVDALEKAVNISGDNAYAYALMARDYALLYSSTSAIDPRRARYKKAALDMLSKAEAVSAPETLRIKWLKSWLHRREII
ncbi:MAG: TPM domain-containing protein [Gammaproteobacteria bacterium]|nr:TPM domain-containing protein [Gammaproteobacteria bacterium]MDH3560794.1 TPM domain-containing protein [Gammaproteobacteria bacterium]